MSETFGEALRRLRTDAGLSQTAVARRARLDPSTVSRYENDKQRPSLAIATRLDEIVGGDRTLRRLGTGNTAPDVLDSEDRQRLCRVFERPHRLDARTVISLGEVLAAQRRLDDVLGPRPLIPVTLAQMDMAVTLLQQSTGPHRDALAEVAAEWVQFAGWLYAEDRQDEEALRLLADAEGAADELGHGILAAQAVNFRGYVARQRQNWPAVTRWFLAEHHTPGASVHQRLGAAAQAAQGFARLGDRNGARRLLDVADRMLADVAQEPAPRTAYWLSPTFHRLNLGLAHLSLASYDVAADHLSTGLDALPPDQQGAAWTVEYRQAREDAAAYR